MRVGDKVVCIDAVWNNLKDGSASVRNHHPKKYKVYTVESKIIERGYDFLIFKEIPYFDKWGDRESYYINQFRKVEPNFSNAITKELADDFIEQDGKRELEIERIFNLNAEF